MKRYAPGFKFPAYSYVPGQFPHPLSSEQGHRFLNTGIETVDKALDRSIPLVRNTIFCYAVDLFNYGYYWESHEQWEHLWHAAGRKGPLADFLKALIKLAAAAVKLKEGVPKGTERHSQRAIELLMLVGDRESDIQNVLVRIDIKSLMQIAEKLQRIAQSENVDSLRSDKDPLSVNIVLQQY